MKFFNISLLFFFCIALICLLNTSGVAAQDADAKRSSPRRPLGKSAKTTTTAAPAEYDAEYPDGENPDQYGEEGEEGAQSSSTTTTEPPKKIGPVIRPFRSNDDFLNSLKRRQMDAKKNRAEKAAARSRPTEQQENDEEEAAPAPAKSAKPSSSGAANRRKFAKPGKPEPQAEEADADAAGSEQQQEDAKLKRPHPRLALRKRA